MPRKTLKVIDFSSNHYRLAEELYFLSSVYKQPSQGSFSLVAYKNDTVSAVPKVVLQVVSDTSRFAHAAGRNNNLRCFVSVKHLGICSISGEFKVFKVKRIVTAEYVILSFLIEHLGVFLKHFCGCSSHRAVYVHVYLSKHICILRMLFIEHIELVYEFLSSSYCKGRNDNASASFDGLKNNTDKFIYACGVGRMKSVAVSRFHNNIVGFLDLHRISQNRPVHHTQVS